ncbi:RNA polymerase sigma factor [Ammoniphilus sp. CFH 90114]|uniref:RNA polymerase sigma factor n=1 Tax=Ammoniphilus sp. CFH 90114 TaxID=2493665 RepID=UPI00100E1BDB|nr:RNA polymerase sigma factor [Ammoniphilus sp. CFH 90114]RXT07788.1 RNA polymerase sigma factor [Ammoniphilus sp. CFH 90114]
MTPRELFERYKEDIYRTCYYMLQNQQDAEDVCQEVFIQAIKHDYQRIEKLKPWLLSMTMNACRNALKKRNRLALWNWTKTWIQPNQSETNVLQSEVRSELSHVLQELPEKIRSIVILRYYHDMKHEEIAEALGIPVGTVKSRCHKAHQTLQGKVKVQKLAEEWGILP